MAVQTDQSQADTDHWVTIEWPAGLSVHFDAVLSTSPAHQDDGSFHAVALGMSLQEDTNQQDL